MTIKPKSVTKQRVFAGAMLSLDKSYLVSTHHHSSYHLSLSDTKRAHSSLKQCHTGTLPSLVAPKLKIDYELLKRCVPSICPVVPVITCEAPSFDHVIIIMKLSLHLCGLPKFDCSLIGSYYYSCYAHVLI